MHKQIMRQLNLPAWLAVLTLATAPSCLPNLAQENPARAAVRSVPNEFPSTTKVDHFGGSGSEPASAPSSSASSLSASLSSPQSESPEAKKVNNDEADKNVALQHYDQFFSSPDLRALIGVALSGNQELNVRLQEILIAQAEVGARRGEIFPKLGVGVGGGIEKVGEYTSQGVSDKAHGVAEHLPNLGFALNASWEVDVWGKLRDAAKAADFRYMASVEAKNFMVTQLVSEVARAYYELVALDNQIDVVKRNIEIQMDALAVAKLEKAAARVTQLAVQRFEAEVLKNRSRLFDLEQERVQTENAINFLLGRYPQPVARRSEDLLVALPVAYAKGLPTQLLNNRPDVRAAELEMQAAELDVGVARARFYPSLSIDASLGYRSFDPAHLVATPASLLYSVAGNLTAPLLNRAAIEADYRAANARQIQAVFNFEKALLQAFTDVANQIAKFENLHQGYDLLDKQVTTLAESVAISTVLFRSARADYMEVLLTRRDSLDAQLELIETKKRLLLSTVSLYQALGGGWR